MSYSDELDAVLARDDADKLIRQLDAYASYYANGEGEWPEEHVEDFSEILECHNYDSEQALAYVILAVARVDDADFLRLMGCSLLEDVLRNPSDEILQRIVAQARKSARFRWMLSCPFKVALAVNAWDAIEAFRITGPHDEPPLDTLPSR
ncbi:DUF6869 domain-containing protein [Novosphingobium sp. EMRT-2]|uniref:DUF6869 domain-containing protein n=1 Tax=Novosphingobium sp. EMRT-2 TaxID=2571749 RepID=UPI0010BD6A73|nr:hypothetical protein [Novosphingobium sp. EMRT-2]QCI93396.1 hypothetical protein FA702_07390 [Novosphingobium sp. EMRT-2]